MYTLAASQLLFLANPNGNKRIGFVRTEASSVLTVTPILCRGIFYR
jgi:hypothetical protein